MCFLDARTENKYIFRLSKDHTYNYGKFVSVTLDDTDYSHVYPIVTSDLHDMFQNVVDERSIDLEITCIFFTVCKITHDVNIYLNEKRMTDLLDVLYCFKCGCFPMRFAEPVIREIYTMLIFVDRLHESHKRKYFNRLNDELLQALHKRKYYKSLKEELVEVAWDPHRMYDWCLDEDEKEHIGCWFPK